MPDLPQPTGGFDWVQVDGRPGLVCRRLAAVAPHVFTTSAWGLGTRRAGSDAAAWAEVARALNVAPDDLVRARQVHGADVVVARAGGTPRGEPADIILTDRPDVGLAVQAADCVPLLVADERRGVVAAAHAGWRGLAARVPSVVVAALGREFGSAAGDLVAAIGPSVGACCYEVGPDVRRLFENAFGLPRLDTWFSHEPRTAARNPPMPGLAREPRQDRWYFDGWASARDQLVEAGLPPASVLVSELCTASHPGAFSSYRRDGPPAGRLAAAIRRAPPRP